ncbi:MAG TPA: cytochrome b N-terminal domain-containing protein [Caulifigura sp.]|nr:cytochrome b N-terminal domain-containing protein [Caulifigura sp.]
MFGRLNHWLESRLGDLRLLTALRERTLPNGPRWSTTVASSLLWLLVAECVTGLLLMATYSPSMTSAWASVHFIDQTTAGRFLRGFHHWTSHAMIILLVVHVARVLITGAFRAPRDLLWITGLLLIPLVIVWTVTGNPLSGSLKGVSQIEVEGNILGSTPIVGPLFRKILIGGDRVGNLTLTHLYFLHVGLLPLIVGFLCFLHLHQVYRHSISVPAESPAHHPSIRYWPHQSIRNAIVLAGVVSIIAAFALVRGAPIDAPADPELPQTPRPEWYFRWLFELRRHFTGQWEFVATMVIPAAVLGFFLMLPFIDRHLSRRTGFAFRTVVVLATLGGWGWLTYVSFSTDWRDPEYLASVERDHELAARAKDLADRQGVAPEGAALLLQNDPKTRGPLLFARHCTSCHSHTNGSSEGLVAAEPSAPDLGGFATADWIGGMLDCEKITSARVYGATKFRDGDMVGKIDELFKEAGADGQPALREKLRLAAIALSAEAGLPSQLQTDRQQAAEIEQGRKLICGELACTDCHRFRDQGDLGSAPDLTGYGSRDWLLGMIQRPQDERYYPGELNDRMPAFARDDVHTETNLLTAAELGLLVDWLRGEWFDGDAPAVESLQGQAEPAEQ